MSRSVTVEAPAKVNLHLQVLGRRPDGYHDLLSLFHAVSLADTVTVRRAGRPGSFRLRGSFDLPTADNLVTRAVEAFRGATGIRDGIAAAVEKRIPAGSGLGGGSSDAAAALRGLAALFDAGLPPGRLHVLAEALGSDVPFFLQSPAALVEGRGERVQPVAPRCDFALVAVLTGLAVRTADAFRWLDEDRSGGTGQGAPGLSPEGLLRAWQGVEPARWGFRNDFDGPVLERFPALRAARDGLLAAGASWAGLTGSGSAVVGICAGRREAEACRQGFVAASGGVPAPRTEVLIPLASLPAICYNRSMRICQGEATHGDNGYSHQEGRG
jgi:4-diphosphocytidyl-2-C-methyl-D-erythritol kinase